MGKVEINYEGLTFGEWTRAACAFRSSPLSTDELVQLEKAWRDGEDPTEWAAYFERKGL
jgi:hypothetical protein